MDTRLTGLENAHARRAARVSVAAWGGRGGRSCIIYIFHELTEYLLKRSENINSLIVGVNHESKLW